MKFVPLLTIAFPTFNRCNAIAKRIDEIFLKSLSRDISVLVVDNQSTDGTWDKLLERKDSFPELQLARNEQNLGFAGNFIRLFEECSSEYLMVMSDEDAVNVDQLPAFIDFLRATEAALISPQAYINDRLYRGKRIVKAITPTEFRDATNYISGCTFDTEKSKVFLSRIASVINTSSAAHLYPQVILSGELVLRYRGVWYPYPLSSKHQELETVIRDLDGASYNDLSSRRRQTLDLLQYFDYLDEEAVGSAGWTGGLKSIKGWIAADLFHQLRHSLGTQNSELAEAFDLEARKFYRRGSRTYNLLRRAFRNPRMVVPALRELINSGPSLK